MSRRMLQRKCSCGGDVPGGECEECRRKRAALQRRSLPGAGTPEVPTSVHATLREPGMPLDRSTRVFMESRFGRDFSSVRVHASDTAAASATAVQALAYTVGHHVVFGPGRYEPLEPGGRRLLMHELAHVVQQASSHSSSGDLVVEPPGSLAEREAERAASDTGNSTPAHWTTTGNRLQRAAIHTGNILEEGSCQHLACNSKWACEDPDGVTCPKGTRNASTTKKFRPLFTCDTKCENDRTCDDADNWMAIPNSRFTRKKCRQDLVICANNAFTHGYVRDRSEREAWEVSPGIQSALGIASGTFSGAIYGDENDAEFKKDARCRTKPAKEIEKKTERESSPGFEGETTSESES